MFRYLYLSALLLTLNLWGGNAECRIDSVEGTGRGLCPRGVKVKMVCNTTQTKRIKIRLRFSDGSKSRFYEAQLKHRGKNHLSLLHRIDTKKGGHYWVKAEIIDTGGRSYETSRYRFPVQCISEKDNAPDWERISDPVVSKIFARGSASDPNKIRIRGQFTADEYGRYPAVVYYRFVGINSDGTEYGDVVFGDKIRKKVIKHPGKHQVSTRGLLMLFDGYVKLELLDSKGNVMKVSKPARIKVDTAWVPAKNKSPKIGYVKIVSPREGAKFRTVCPVRIKVKALIGVDRYQSSEEKLDIRTRWWFRSSKQGQQVSGWSEYSEVDWTDKITLQYAPLVKKSMKAYFYPEVQYRKHGSQKWKKYKKVKWRTIQVECL